MKTILLFLCVSISAFSQTISLQPFGTGFASPVDIATAGDSRLFIVEQDGIIKILNSNGTVNATPFLNISNLTNANGEQGLLGLAFDPNYTSNGYFYVHYSALNGGDTAIARYKVSANNPNVADPTGTVILTVDQPFGNHNGGCMKFGPDGFLYIGLGDGGSGGDPNGYAQNLNIDPANPSRVLLGKMLRLQVTNSITAPFYTIPATNPYRGQAGKEEIWAIGLRNPWRFSFDSATGNLWIADVGQNNFEEINRSSTTQPQALNYGWRCYEGNATFNTANCPAVSTISQPLVAINHNTGACSITGGFVYNGPTYPALQGKYLFSDFCDNRIGMVTANGTLSYSAAFPGRSFASFGVDNTNEMYVAAIDNGVIYKIVDAALSVDSESLKNIVISPNPIDDSFIINGINANDNTMLDLYDMAGRKMFTTAVYENTPITLLFIPSGVYIARVSTESGLTRSSKIIKN